MLASFEVTGLIWRDDGIRLLLHGDVVADDVSEIGLEATARVFAVILGHFGVVSCPGNADERLPVDVHSVDFSTMVFVDDV